jgi:hypothetical protein
VGHPFLSHRRSFSPRSAQSLCSPIAVAAECARPPRGFITIKRLFCRLLSCPTWYLCAPPA